MNTEFMSSTFALHASEEDRAVARIQALEELPKMSQAMIDEEGLLNAPQAGLLLNVSTKRISELVREKKLKSFQFFGRTYVSVKDVRKRYREGLRAGFPPLTRGRRMIASVRAALKTDRHQAKLGGYAGPPVRAKREKQKSKRKARNEGRAISE